MHYDWRFGRTHWTHLFSGTISWRLLLREFLNSPSLLVGSQCCLQWYVHFLSFCEYDNRYSYLVLMTFECDVNEIWHMDNNFTAVNKFAAARSTHGLVP